MALRDIKDVEAFVKACIVKTGMRVGDLYDDWVAAGIVELYNLSERYNPSLDLGDKASFAGFAWFLMPKKLISAWHRMNPHHVLSTHHCNGECSPGCDMEGKRMWVYYQKPSSLEYLMEGHTNGGEPHLYRIDERKVRHAGDFVAPNPPAASELQAE